MAMAMAHFEYKSTIVSYGLAMPPSKTYNAAWLFSRKGGNPEKPMPSRDVSQESLLDRVPALVWTTGPECRFTSLSGALLRGTGVGSEEYLGKPVDTLFRGSDTSNTALCWHQRAGPAHRPARGHAHRSRSLNCSTTVAATGMQIHRGCRT